MHEGPLTGDTETLDMAAVQQFVTLKQQIKLAGDNIDDLKAKAAAIEEQLLEEFAGCGIQKMSVEGGTVYMRRQIWAGYGPGLNKESSADEAATAKNALLGRLKGDADWAYLIGENYHAGQLSAAVRELPRDLEDNPILPENLRDVMKVTERYDLRVVK